MNLLFLDSVDKDTFGGYENWILLAAGHFLERGHNATLAGRTGSEYLRRGRLACDNAKILELDIHGDFSPGIITKIRRYLIDNKIDLMTVNFNKDVRLGGLAAKASRGTKVVWRIGLDITSRGIAHRLLTPKLVDGVVVPSMALKRQVMRHGYLTDDMVRVIHNGTAEKQFNRPDAAAASALREKYGLPSDSLICVTAGRFVEQKGHGYLVNAARRVVDAVPEARFLFLGDGHLESELRYKVSTHRLDEQVIFCGMLDNIDLELSGADLMVHSAIEEPFSHAILEGMRAGLPIVATEVGGIPEALTDGKTALLVPARDSEMLAGAVIELLRSPERRLAFGTANQERWRRDFRVESMMKKTESYFGEILG